MCTIPGLVPEVPTHKRCEGVFLKLVGEEISLETMVA